MVMLVQGRARKIMVIRKKDVDQFSSRFVSLGPRYAEHHGGAISSRMTRCTSMAFFCHFQEVHYHA